MKIFVNVKEIINEWDPVSLLHDAPNDEYEDEIREIVNQLPTVQSMEELAVDIHKIFVRNFGEDLSNVAYNTISECRPIAKKIWNRLDLR